MYSPFGCEKTVELSKCLPPQGTTLSFFISISTPSLFLRVRFICITQGGISSDSSLAMEFSSAWLSALKAVEGVRTWECDIRVEPSVHHHNVL